MELYSWQKRCLTNWEANGYRGIVDVVTGAGKTVLAIEAARRLRKLKPELMVRIVVPTIPLANQWRQALLRAAASEEERPGLFGGDRRDHEDHRVMVYIVNSARKALPAHIRRDTALQRPMLLICDECHHYQSRENRKIFSFLKEEGFDGRLYSCLGLSATPFQTEDDGFLKEALGQEIYRYGFERAVNDGIVSRFSLCSVSVSFLQKELRKYAEICSDMETVTARLLKAHKELKALLGTELFLREVTAIAKRSDMDPSEPAAAFLLLAYRRKEISVLAESRIRCCVALLRRMPKLEKVILFCERIEQAEQLAGVIRREGIRRVGLYHSGLSKEARRRVLEEFRQGETSVLAACRCLDEGIDVPDAGTGIVVSSSAVPRQRIQRLGRVIRRAEGKDKAVLYYLYVRESRDDASYLEGTGEDVQFDLRYYPEEDEFSNAIYEYAARELLKRAGNRLQERDSNEGHTAEGWDSAERGDREEKGKKTGKRQLAELRTCILEGLPRADYLLPEEMVRVRERSAFSLHERNYWMCMRQMGRMVRKE